MPLRINSINTPSLKVSVDAHLCDAVCLCHSAGLCVCSSSVRLKFAPKFTPPPSAVENSGLFHATFVQNTTLLQSIYDIRKYTNFLL
jgi:hypothetical protein